MLTCLPSISCSCAKMKNTCQTCLLDLQYGLPTQFRDAAAGKGNDSGPKDNLNKAYVAQNAESHLENVTASSFGKSDPAVKELLKKLARQDPNYARSRPTQPEQPQQLQLQQQQFASNSMSVQQGIQPSESPLCARIKITAD